MSKQRRVHGRFILQAEGPFQADDREPEPGRMFHVYACYRRDGVLLYVGMSGISGLRRMSSHQAKPWWHEVAYVKVEHYPREHLARMRERELIYTGQAVHNVQGRKPRTTPWRGPRYDKR